MSDFGTFPDAEQMSAAVLINARTAAALGGFTPQVGTRLPDTPDFTKGVVVVTRTGGTPAERIRVDRPRIQIDVWHADKAKAYALAEACRLAMFDAEGSVVLRGATELGVLTGVDLDQSPTWMMDPLNFKPRYMQTLRLTTHQVDA